MTDPTSSPHPQLHHRMTTTNTAIINPSPQTIPCNHTAWDYPTFPGEPLAGPAACSRTPEWGGSRKLAGGCGTSPQRPRARDLSPPGLFHPTSCGRSRFACHFGWNGNQTAQLRSSQGGELPGPAANVSAREHLPSAPLLFLGN